MPDTTVVVQGGATTSVVVNPASAAIVVPAAVSTSVAVTQLAAQTVTAIAQQGPPGTGTFDTVHTYAVGGDINVPVGDTNLIPPFFFVKRVNQTSTLKKVMHKINSGTLATVKLTKNGVDLTSYTGIAVTTTTATTAADRVLADGDVIQLVVTAISGSPKNLTLTLVIEHTVT